MYVLTGGVLPQADNSRPVMVSKIAIRVSTREASEIRLVTHQILAPRERRQSPAGSANVARVVQDFSEGYATAPGEIRLSGA